MKRIKFFQPKKFAPFLILILLVVNIAFAVQKMIEADGFYIVSADFPENPNVAMERARADAKRAASEQVGVVVETVSEMKNGNLTRDEIRTVSAAVLQIHNESMTVESLGGSVSQYHCHISATVDNSNITKKT